MLPGQISLFFGGRQFESFPDISSFVDFSLHDTFLLLSAVREHEDPKQPGEKRPARFIPKPSARVQVRLVAERVELQNRMRFAHLKKPIW